MIRWTKNERSDGVALRCTISFQNQRLPLFSVHGNYKNALWEIHYNLIHIKLDYKQNKGEARYYDCTTNRGAPNHPRFVHSPAASTAMQEMLHICNGWMFFRTTQIQHAWIMCSTQVKAWKTRQTSLVLTLMTFKNIFAGQKLFKQSGSLSIVLL